MAIYFLFTCITLGQLIGTMSDAVDESTIKTPKIIFGLVGHPIPLDAAATPGYVQNMTTTTSKSINKDFMTNITITGTFVIAYDANGTDNRALKCQINFPKDISDKIKICKWQHPKNINLFSKDSNSKYMFYQKDSLCKLKFARWDEEDFGSWQCCIHFTNESEKPSCSKLEFPGPLSKQNLIIQIVIIVVIVIIFIISLVIIHCLNTNFLNYIYAKRKRIDLDFVDRNFR